MHQQGYIGRKMRQPNLKKDTAIVIATFVGSSRAQAAMEMFAAALAAKYPEKKVYWAYTSEILRKKTGLPSLQQTLAQVEADGYRKAVVQPLHIFPGTEYQQLLETCNYFPGLRIITGETLLHRWEFVRDLLRVLEQEFLSPEEGCNLLAIHGTPLCMEPANVIYMGLRQLVEDFYVNVQVATVEGVPYHEALLRRMAREKIGERFRRIKIIPVMYFAGHHVEDDLMGETNSLKEDLEKLGLAVECPKITVDGKTNFKGLAYYPEVVEGFLARLERTLRLDEHY